MKKYLTILLLLAIALLSSCNLDNQGIFAEVIDRVPSDNRKLSFIGDDSNKVYFKSVNGIESYDLDNGTYKTLDSSENARKNNIFVFNKTDKVIIYFVDKATSDGVAYDSCYKLDIDSQETTKLTNNSNIIFADSYNEYLIGKDGKIYSYSIADDKTISFTLKAEVSDKYYVKNIDNIFAFSTKSTDSTTKNLEYYKFKGDIFTPITSEDATYLGKLRSVTTDAVNGTQYLFFSEVNGQAETSVFKLTDTEFKKLGKLSSSNVGRDFESFVDSGVDSDNLYFAYDGSSILNKYNLTSGELTSTTISKLGNVAIVGYFKVGTDYKICTANNGFLTLSLDGTPHLK
ncbi:MAG: hypothetical protein PUH25_06500 [Spirochaetales bacterium]|nr:hypothetical protein [Spirochaetales bacterium]